MRVHVFTCKQSKNNFADSSSNIKLYNTLMNVLSERVKWNASEVSNITLLLRCKIQTVKTSHLLKAQPQQHSRPGGSASFEFLILYETVQTHKND